MAKNCDFSYIQLQLGIQLVSYFPQIPKPKKSSPKNVQMSKLTNYVKRALKLFKKGVIITMPRIPYILAAINTMKSVVQSAMTSLLHSTITSVLHSTITSMLQGTIAFVLHSTMTSLLHCTMIFELLLKCANLNSYLFMYLGIQRFLIIIFTLK